MEVMFNGGVTVVLIGHGLLNNLTNTDYVEHIVAPHPVFSFTNESIISFDLN